ncbi:peritrophin-1-like [Physella acuta]|uniref:peritrophin-1-like n=1 Tax=Physella acuta TaxID=109671 RepID=UPI0027DC535F|nr:peritrophin-1-like [Physella acuta]XP_059153186.1 peritrophin-1-like [Physella acuta]
MTPQILILALTIGLALSVPSSNRCPQPTATNPTPAAFLYGSPDDCQKFFMCNYGNPIRMSCPATTTFNELYQTCVNRNSEFDTCTRPSVPVPSSNRCPQPTEANPNPNHFLYGSPDDCQTFFNCDHGNPIRMSCPALTTFNERLQVCVHKGSIFDTCTR